MEPEVKDRSKKEWTVLGLAMRPTDPPSLTALEVSFSYIAHPCTILHRYILYTMYFWDLLCIPRRILCLVRPILYLQTSICAAWIARVDTGAFWVSDNHGHGGTFRRPILEKHWLLLAKLSQVRLGDTNLIAEVEKAQFMGFSWTAHAAHPDATETCVLSPCFADVSWTDWIADKV